MPPRRKRIRSDDSENSTVDSKGLSSGSDVQMHEKLKNTRHQNRKINSEDYDGDSELERHDKNRVTKTAVRSRALKQRMTNNLNSGSSSSTPVTQMDVDNVSLYGFENLITPIPCSPVARFHIASPKSAAVAKRLPVLASPILAKPVFETPAVKLGKKFKRKRVARGGRKTNEDHTWLESKQREDIIAHFHDVDEHELLIE